MMTSNEITDLITQVEEGLYTIEQALEEIAKAADGRMVRAAIYGALLNCYQDGKAGSGADLLARAKLEALESGKASVADFSALSKQIRSLMAASHVIKSGMTDVVTVEAGSYVDIPVTFDHTYTSPPRVVATISGGSTSVNYGLLTLTVPNDSITTTGCTLRLFNRHTALFQPRVVWVAIGDTAEDAADLLANVIDSELSVVSQNAISNAAAAAAIEEQAAQIQQNTDDISLLSQQIADLPFIDVSLASDMTDAKKIYRYNGSEDGYTKGALYYYDNDKAEWKKVGIGSTGGNAASGYNLPTLYLTGDDSGMSHDDAVQMQYVYIDPNANKQRTGWCTVKWQGDSSLQYDKKNYTIKFFHDINVSRKDKIEFFDGVKENKCVAKANWIDHSHARNIVSARLWGAVVKCRHKAVPDELASSYNYGSIDGFPIKIYLNKLYHGLYTLNIPKEDFTFGMDEDNPLHCAVGANYQGATAEFRANGDSIYGWEAEVPDELSTDMQTALLNTIKFVTNATDEEFISGLDSYIDVESAIDYYLFMYFIGGTDNLVKNIIMLTYDATKWYMHAYDLDSTFGGRYDGGTFYPYNVACPEGYQGTNSLLWERMESIFSNELYARYKELRASVFDVDYICRELEQFVSLVPEEEYEADADLWTDVPHKGEDLLSQMQTWITNRAGYVDIEIANLVDPVNATAITLNTTEYEFVSATTNLALLATVEPSTATDVVVWASSDESVATVSSSGIVTPVGSGSCIITATAGTVSTTCSITVMEGLFEAGAIIIKLSVEYYGFNGSTLTLWKGLSTSDFISLPDGDYDTVVVNDYVKTIVFYDENQSVISYAESISYSLKATLRAVIPTGAKYFRICCNTSIKTNKYVAVSTGNSSDYVFPVSFSDSAIYKADSDGNITEDGSYYMAEISHIPADTSRLLFLGKRPTARQYSYILYDAQDNILVTEIGGWVNAYDAIDTATSATKTTGCVFAAYNLTTSTYGLVDHAKLLILPEGSNAPEAAVCYR